MAKTTPEAGGDKDVDYFLKSDGLDSAREKDIGQHIGYRYDVNLVPDYERITPFLKSYMEAMGWDDLNWLEDVHMGYEEGRPAVFDRNINGWVTVPADMDLPESFFQLLKRELIRRQTYPTRQAARQDVFEYIELFYNPKRKHTNTSMLSPVNFEERQLKLKKAGVYENRGTSKCPHNYEGLSIFIARGSTGKVHFERPQLSGNGQYSASNKKAPQTGWGALL